MQETTHCHTVAIHKVIENIDYNIARFGGDIDF